MHDFRIFFIGKGSSNYRTLGKARKIPAFVLSEGTATLLLRAQNEVKEQQPYYSGHKNKF
jgi:hypothetical protein